MLFSQGAKYTGTAPGTPAEHPVPSLQALAVAKKAFKAWEDLGSVQRDHSCLDQGFPDMWVLLLLEGTLEAIGSKCGPSDLARVS